MLNVHWTMYNESSMNESIKNHPMDLRERTMIFSKSVVAFCNSMSSQTQLRPLLGQLIRSATSIGANFVEAKDSVSRKDFRNKVLISKKEAAETNYWLSILEDYAPKGQIKALQKECREITLILQSIVNKLRH